MTLLEQAPQQVQLPTPEQTQLAAMQRSLDKEQADLTPEELAIQAEQRNPSKVPEFGPKQLDELHDANKDWQKPVNPAVFHELAQERFDATVNQAPATQTPEEALAKVNAIVAEQSQKLGLGKVDAILAEGREGLAALGINDRPVVTDEDITNGSSQSGRVGRVMSWARGKFKTARNEIGDRAQVLSEVAAEKYKSVNKKTAGLVLSTIALSSAGIGMVTLSPGLPEQGSRPDTYVLINPDAEEKTPGNIVAESVHQQEAPIPGSTIAQRIEQQSTAVDEAMQHGVEAAARQTASTAEHQS